MLTKTVLNYDTVQFKPSHVVFSMHPVINIVLFQREAVVDCVGLLIARALVAVDLVG